MRKLLLLSLPIAIVAVISLSFYVLLRTNSHSFPITQVSAATNKKKLLRLKVTPTKTPRVKRTPTPTPTRKPTPTPTATPTPTVKPTATPTPTQTQASGEDEVQTYIMQKINDYRSSQGLSSVKTDSNTCDFAKTRAQEITSSFTHDGFTNRINNHTLPYPSYHEVTENIAMTSNYQEVVTMWINSPGHAENMRQDTPYVCVEKSGNYYAYEGWRP